MNTTLPALSLGAMIFLGIIPQQALRVCWWTARECRNVVRGGEWLECAFEASMRA
jgi:hypothetical protein